MELTQLKYFRAVAKNGNLTKTADSLYISQSALSKTISRLEKDIGVRLFDRNGSKIYLNDFGRTFLQYTDKILNLIDEGCKTVREMAGIEHGRVSVSSCINQILAEPLQRFYSEHPNVHIYHHYMPDDEAKKALLNHEVDYAIINGPISDSKLQWEELFPQELFLLMSPQHPIAQKGIATIDEALTMPFARTGHDYDLPDSVMRELSDAGFKPEIIFDGNSEEVEGCIVGTGSAFGFMPLYDYFRIVERFGNVPDLVAVCFDVPCRRWSIGIASLKSRTYSGAAVNFKKYVMDCSRELRPELERVRQSIYANIKR